MRQTLSDLYKARVDAGTLRADPAQLALLQPLEELRQWLENTPARKSGFLAGLFGKAPPPPPPGLYLWGGVGRGKSMLMDLFTEATNITAKRRVHFHAFMQEVHKALHEAREKGIDDPLTPIASKIASELRLLAFDEMQITDITDAMLVGRLFEKLFEGGVLIVTTSNRPPEDLYKNGLNRQLFTPFIALIRQKLTVHEIISANDYRQHRLTGAQVYFSPAGNALPQLEAIWADLTGNAKGEIYTIEVNGRLVEIPRYSNGVGWASFWDLCAKPLGPADYLAIARNLRVLFISDIPQLSSANFNQAKRFVTLIDALYEAKVKVICSAADEPERLYVEGEGAFEFERTASRLREMQDANWGQENEQ